MYNFVNCLQLNIRYEKVERPAAVGGVLVINRYNANTVKPDLVATSIKQLEEFEDTKGAIIICISKENRQHNGQKKNTKGQTTIYKTYT